MVEVYTIETSEPAGQFGSEIGPVGIPTVKVIKAPERAEVEAADVEVETG